MKIAVLSDIHGNMPALEMVADDIAAWQPDHVVVNGDIVNRGPDSLAAWQFVRAQSGWQLLKGNHEEYVIQHRANDLAQRKGILFAINYMSYWTYLQHNEAVDDLAELPDDLSLFVPDGSEVRLRHGSMKHNRDSILPDASDEKLREQIEPLPAVFASAHTHLPFVRMVGSTLVVNSGSVGTSADGDKRTGYAQIAWERGRWAAQIVRLSYDLAGTRQRYFDSGFLAEAGPIGWLIFYEWWQATSLVPRWMQRWSKAVVAGEIDLETAVCHYLAELGLPIPQ